jgi:hypothetical protein
VLWAKQDVARNVAPCTTNRVRIDFDEPSCFEEIAVPKTALTPLASETPANILPTSRLFAASW